MAQDPWFEGRFPGFVDLRRAPPSRLPSGIDGAPLTTHSCGGSCGLGPGQPRTARIPVSPSFPKDRRTKALFAAARAALSILDQLAQLGAISFSVGKYVRYRAASRVSSL